MVIATIVIRRRPIGLEGLQIISVNLLCLEMWRKSPRSKYACEYNLKSKRCC